MFREFKPADYADTIAEHVKPYSWLKFPYIKDLGYPDGVYRVSPLSRLNVADKMPDAAPAHRSTSRNSGKTSDTHSRHSSTTGQGS